MEKTKEVRFSVWLNGEHYMYAASSDDAKSFLLSQVFKPFLDEAKDMNELYVRAYELKDEEKSYPKCRYVNQDECPYYPTDCYNCLHPDEDGENE